MNTTAMSFYNVSSPVSCEKLRLVGYYCIILFIISLSVNGIFLFMFLKIKKLRTPMNGLMMILAVFNLLGTLVCLPLVTVSSFTCKYNYGQVGCYSEGFLMYYVGCVNIYMLAIISFERYWVIQKPLSIRFISFKACVLAICMCSIVSFFWAGMPLIGWSNYSIEGAGISCSVEWNVKNFNVSSYNISMLVFVYIIPLVVLMTTSIKLVLRVKATRMIRNNVGDSTTKRRINKEAQLTIMTFFLILTYMLAWTPYAVVAIYSAFISNTPVEPLTATIPSLIAKSSLVWPSLINIIVNRDVRGYLAGSRAFNTIGPTSRTNGTESADSSFRTSTF